MNVGAIIMLLVGAIGLWGGLILFIRHYLAAAREETRTAAGNSGSTE